jgi:prephenate dehydrogenase
MPFKALVIGGAGGMGRWCSQALKSAGMDVSISSRKDASAIAKSLGVGVSQQSKAGEFDIIVLSVPMDALDGIVSEIAPMMRPGSLLMDLSSLKKEPVETMLGHTSQDVEVIGTHPLFGPDIKDVRGRTIVIVPTERSKKWFPIIHDALEKTGANIEITTAEDHDNKMAIVQGLTHFVHLAIARAYERMGADLKGLEPYKTPVFSISNDITGRILSQDPGMYALIQAGEHVKQVRSEFEIACRELASDINEGRIDEFVKTLSSAAKYYGDTGLARRRSERIIEKSIEDELFIKSSAGTEQVLYIAGEPGPVAGIIKDAGRDGFTFETPSKVMRLSYGEVKPVTGEEMKALKSMLSPKVTRYIKVGMPKGANVKMLKWVLTRIDGVSDISDEKKGGEDPVGVYRFTIELFSYDSEKTLEKVLSTIKGLGYEVK